MLRCVLRFVLVGFVLSPGMATAQENTLILDSTGRVLSPFTRGERLRKVRVEVRDGALDDGAKTRRLHCRPLPSFDNTAQPSDDDEEHVGREVNDDLIFEVDPPRGAQFLFCSLLRQDNMPLSVNEERRLQEEVEKAIAAIEAATAALANTAEGKALAVARNDTAQTKAKLERELAQRRAQSKTAIANIEIEIERYQTDIAAFQGAVTDSAVTEIKRLQSEVRTLRGQITNLNGELTKMEEQLNETLAKLVEAETNALAKANATAESRALRQAEQVRTKINAQLAPGSRRRFTVLNYSHLLLGRDDTPVYYRLLYRPDQNQPVVALERSGKFPVFTTDSRIYAVVVNRKLSELPEPFRLTFTQTAGTVPDPAPVRPTFPASLQAGRFSDYEGLPNAYGDFVMSFGAPFRANTILKVKISTVLKQITEDSEKTTATDGKLVRTATNEVKQQNADLLKDEEYPQVRGLYYFNFTSGAAVSWLRDSTFVRRQIKPDDPATTPTNEAEFEDQEVRGDRTVKPIFAVSVYLKPVDIQKPLAVWDRLTPAFLLGFSFVNPQDNIYVGAAFEPIKSLQVIGGKHIGKITRKREPAAVAHPSSATAPATDQRYDHAWFTGVSFNLGFIKTIFTGR